MEKERKNLKSKDEETQGLAQRVKKEEAKIDQLKENQWPGYEEETKRKDQLLKNLKKDLKTKQKREKRASKKETREDRPTSIKHL